MTAVRNCRRVYYMIYLSHALSAWGDRMWDFAVGLYMVILFPDSLLLTAVLGFSISLAVTTFGGPLGTWIDKTKRITSATVSIIVQNAAVILGSTALALTFAFSDEIQQVWNGSLQTLIYAFIIFVSVIAKLASVTSDIAIERDWIVILTDGDESSLATMNSVMRTIDLTTKILAPLAIGTLLTYWSQMSGAIFIAIWNLISGFVEIYLLVIIYGDIPQLRLKHIDTENEPGRRSRNAIKECWGGWRQYLMHPIKWAGIGFSCLYMTVLGFDQTTTGYMYSQGVDESFIGITTSLGAITGIIGSVSYPFLRRCCGKNSTTLIGYVSNAACFFICVVSIFTPGSPFDPTAIVNPFGKLNATAVQQEKFSIAELWEQRQNMFYFVAGIVFARFGLWVTDLSISQLLQDSVEESKRGVINGVQNSINQSMDLIKFVFVIFLPSPQTFGYLIILTWIFSILGCLLHCLYLFRSRSHDGHGKDSTIGQLLEKDESNSMEKPKTERTPLLPTK
ncbi:Solute carrier family 40 member 1 [Orchesella cincta]|uniref:Solute carrier family 40 member n=1 Tax=Orchesella cincta TaxID=48709 RepID=A0A1D2MYK6_ORCCI|nr:Solute carrier family 40 member 1 [Orchesella cincta]